MAKSILLMYHFFYPDPVISARLFSDLAEDFVHAGHEVMVFTGNRLIRSDVELPAHEKWNGATIRRFSRRNFSQGGNFGRLFNSAVLQVKWLWAFLQLRRKFDTVIVGTDPQFSYLMFPFLRLMNRKVRLIHWVFDLYPEAILVNSSKWMRLLANLTKPFVSPAYRQVDVMADIDNCMRERLRKYRHNAKCVTLTPWALAEPESVPEADPEIRRKLFGDAEIGLLYSGTIGHAHDIRPFIELARECRRYRIDAAFCFAGYGNRYQEQTSELTDEDINIRLAGFASEEELEKRLAAADLHLISLREGWEGIVVPSKFFGALAIGRPVLFSGPVHCSIAGYCREFGIGLHLSEQEAIEYLNELIRTPDQLKKLQKQAFDVYQKHFSRQAVLENWHEILCSQDNVPIKCENQVANNSVLSYECRKTKI